ncbi:MAG: glycosyltransferase [Ignavibacteriales bacterium]
MSQRRALFVILGDDPGGSERVVCSLASELARDPAWRTEVFVATHRKTPSFVGANLPPEVTVEFGEGLGLRAGALSILRRLSGRRYDFLFSTNMVGNVVLSLMRTLRLIRAERFVTRESTVPLARFSGLKALAYRLMYRVYGGQTLIVAQTSTMAAGLRGVLPRRLHQRIRVQPNPVDWASLEAGASAPLDAPTRAQLAGADNVLFCGRLIEVKRPRLALEAFAHAAAQTERPLRLVFLGKGPLEDEVRARAAELGVEERVLFLGYRTDPHAVMSACQYGILTSSHEGYPNVVPEMLACGVRRVVVTDCAGDLDRLKGVDVVREGTPQALGEALIGALRSPSPATGEQRAQIRERSAAGFLDAILGR